VKLLPLLFIPYFLRPNKNVALGVCLSTTNLFCMCAPNRLVVFVLRQLKEGSEYVRAVWRKIKMGMTFCGILMSVDLL
jgi:hypothetical protein